MICLSGTKQGTFMRVNSFMMLADDVCECRTFSAVTVWFGHDIQKCILPVKQQFSHKFPARSVRKWLT